MGRPHPLAGWAGVLVLVVTVKMHPEVLYLCISILRCLLCGPLDLRRIGQLIDAIST